MLPPCVSRDYSAPQSLRAGLSSSVKREKISPVLQTTYNSQMWPGRLETISFDRVSSMRTAKIPQPLVRNPPIKNSWMRPCRLASHADVLKGSSRVTTCICYSYGIKTLLEISKKSPEISAQQMFMKVTSFQFLRKINSVWRDGDSNRDVATADDYLNHYTTKYSMLNIALISMSMATSLALKRS